MQNSSGARLGYDADATDAKFKGVCILRRYCGICPSSGWLFIEHTVRFFSATQWRTFYRDCSARSAVRIVVMDAENLFSGSHVGKHGHRVQPSDQSFFYSLFHMEP